MTKWCRVRFHANYSDSRPVKVEPPGPWWETGFAADESYSTVVAYFPENKKHRLTEFWPEADAIDWHGIEDKPTFTDRFPKPDEWDEENACYVDGVTVAD